MKSYFQHQHTACHSCDLLVRMPSMSAGEKATCPRCGHLLARQQRYGLALSQAFAFSGLFFLALSLAFPFLAFEAQGRIQQMTLFQSAVELVNQGYASLAVLLLLFILLLPALLLLSICVLTTLLNLSHAPVLCRRIARLLSTVEPWCMVEVFLIGMLVSLIKISSMADVILGLSFWAYVAFSVSMAGAMANMDYHNLWHRIGQLSK